MYFLSQISSVIVITNNLYKSCFDITSLNSHVKWVVNRRNLLDRISFRERVLTIPASWSNPAMRVSEGMWNQSGDDLTGSGAQTGCTWSTDWRVAYLKCAANTHTGACPSRSIQVWMCGYFIYLFFFSFLFISLRSSIMPAKGSACTCPCSA